MQKINFSSTETLDAWMGGGFYDLKRKFKIGKYMICIWKVPEGYPFDEMLKPAKPMQEYINRKLKDKEVSK